jgi:hypothetical protein
MVRSAPLAWTVTAGVALAALAVVLPPWLNSREAPSIRTSRLHPCLPLSRAGRRCIRSQGVGGMFDCTLSSRDVE